MKLLRNKNFILTLCLLLVALLCIPSIVKMGHALYGHEHLECTADGELHIHEVELDCDFNDFNLSPQFQSRFVQVPRPLIVHISNNLSFQYTFLSKYQKLHFALRGPPQTS